MPSLKQLKRPRLPKLPARASKDARPKGAASPTDAATPTLTRYLFVGATLSVALGIGYVMQSGLSPEQPIIGEPVPVTNIKLASSSAMVLPALPADRVAEGMSGPPVTLAALSDREAGPDLQLNPQPIPSVECRIDMTADPAAGALVSLSLTAPCHAGERVTLHHQGVRVTETLSENGTLDTRFPALAEEAFFMASFASGDGATASTKVSALPFYDRAVLQWTGESGLGLHAREFTDAYFVDGHVWSGQTGTVADAALGQSGFLMRLGDASAPNALLAEVYSFPTGTAQKAGAIRLTVEAEVTEANCARTVEAQIMQLRVDARLRARDLTLDMPGCDGSGDFLVLKNLMEDLTIASN